VNHGTPAPETIGYLRGVLVRWYRACRRDLPWRRTSDPYHILVSETMLQQTRVVAVVPYYERFVGRFPDLRSLAGAPADDVLALWSGLGYYRRARLLQKACVVVEAVFGGVLPDDPEILETLPGVGRYTAGAIASIAFGRSVPLLDGNVFRVLSRFFAMKGSWEEARTRRRFWDLAADLVPARNAGDFNQALMELGALVCTPRGVACSSCPLRRRCAALARGSVEEHPPPRRRPPVRKRRKTAYVVTDRRGKVLIERRPGEGRMAGMWELPGTPPVATPRASRTGSFRHALLDRLYEVSVYRLSVARRPVGQSARRRWVAREELASYPLTAMARKGIDLAGS